MTARTPEGDALYERVLSELDAEAVAEALVALPAPRAELVPGTEPADDAAGAPAPAGPVLTGEVVDLRVEAVPVGARRRSWAALTAAVLAVACLGAALWCFPSARTEAGTAAAPQAASADLPAETEADRLTLAAQRALDRVLGAGHSVVTVTAEYADPTERWTERFGPTAVPTAQATATASGTDGSGGGYRYDGRVTDNGVDRTVEHVVGGGRVTRLSVAVVVDAAAAPAPSVAAVRAWVGPAVGLQPRRGDQVSVVALPMASGRVVTPPPATRVVRPAVRDYALTVGFGLLALLLAAIAVRSVWRGRRAAGRRGERGLG